MNCIISKYVYQFISSRKENLVYCSRSNSFLKITPQLYEYLEMCKDDSSLINALDDELLDLLKKHKIIVSNKEDSDFLLEHQIITDQISYSKSILGLTLVPTIACNFECPYCFESNKRPKTMNEEIIEQLISFLKLHIEPQYIDITWYGGEPLLAFDIIKKILERIHSEINIPIRRHSIITNGYYFDSKVIELFKKYPLDSIQITLDGSRERHNSIRKQKHTGEGSYDRLIHNMDNILEELPQTKLSVRVNIERENIQDFFDVQESLSERWRGKNVSIYPGILRIDNEDQTALSCNSLERIEIDELIFSLRSNKILEAPIFPSLNCRKNCSATMLNSFIIGPIGEIYKCWNDVSDDSKIIGYINNEKLSNSILLQRYIVGSKWYHNSECRECFFLPICQGNCAWYRLRNMYENGKYVMCNCLQKSPNMLNKCLEYYYINKLSNSI